MNWLQMYIQPATSLHYMLVDNYLVFVDLTMELLSICAQIINTKCSNIDIINLISFSLKVIVDLFLWRK